MSTHNENTNYPFLMNLQRWLGLLLDVRFYAELRYGQLIGSDIVGEAPKGSQCPTINADRAVSC
ncbi:hypothetical protein [Xenorhabdus poinarii]|uniref:hypothetical protein n=1 Tax=Xenorhabdus poinarii TaxID=40577 RepID=UPI0012FF1ABE|nr:hypothetical protein [Xenorhabdus poinarii]